MSSFYSDATLQMVRHLRESGKTAYEIGLQLPGLTPDLSHSAIRNRGQRALSAMRQRVSSRDEPEPLPSSIPGDHVQTTESTHTVVRVTPTQVTTLEELLAFCQVDTEEWEVDRWSCNSWGMGYKTKDGTGATHPLYQVKASFRRRVVYKSNLDAIKASLQEIISITPARIDKAVTYPRENPILWTLSMPDLHLGKLAHRAETGQNYNLEIATRVYKTALEDLIRDAQNRQIGRIVFPVGNDLMNFDNLIGTTTAGTPQKQGHLYQHVFSAALGLMVWSLDLLEQIAPVSVISVPGNHDALSAWTLTETLRAYYRNSANIQIENSPKPRKTFLWGECGIMYTHGKDEKWSSLPMIMMSENRDVWSYLQFPEIHLGHRHTSQGLKLDYDEINGVKLRVLPSLSATDSWHFSKGYVGNIRSAESYYYHKNAGFIGSAVHNVI